MTQYLRIVMVAAAGIVVLAWVGAFTPQAAGQAPAPPPAFVPGTESGFATFQTQCASCHGNPNVDRAPTPAALREMTPEKIYAAMTTGLMQQQSSALNDGQKKALAEFMAGRPMGSAASGSAPRTWASSAAPTRRSPIRPPGPSWNGWSPDLANTRFQPAQVARLTAAQVPRLKLKWAFGFPSGRLGQRTADRRIGPRVRRQRQRLRVFDRREDRAASTGRSKTARSSGTPSRSAR